MFAARANQENTIYEQQTAAAAKPLNQGVKGFAPKTPANKPARTPFKAPLNDENVTFGVPKTAGKVKQDGLFGEGKSGKAGRNTLVTPAGKQSSSRSNDAGLTLPSGPRNRAPLGNKTTNAKGNALQTPAPPVQDKASARATSPRVRRGKIKIHDAGTMGVGNEDRIPEIEYMPPREIPLPDYPDEWPHDRTYPQFEGANLTRGWWSEFARQKGDDDDSDFSDFEGKLTQIEERQRKERQAMRARPSPAVKRPGLKMTARDPLSQKQPQTLNARSAASALSAPNSTVTPRFAAPTAATQSRATSLGVPKRSGVSGQAPVGNARHGAARVASNTTVGYSQGRAVRKPSLGVTGEQLPGSGDKMASPGQTSLDELFSISKMLSLDGEDDDDLGGGVLVGGDVEDEDEAEVFQLPPVDY